MKRQHGFLNVLVGGMLLAGSSAFSAMPASAMTFTAEHDRVLVEGTTDRHSLEELEEVLDDNPDVRMLVLGKVEGSDDDSTNLRMAEFVRGRGLTTHLTSQSVIESGGIELFMGGVRRTMERGARIGVHSWMDEDKGYQGRDLAPDHPDHQEYLNAYRALGTPEVFYWFILKAAPSTAMYFLNEEEIARFNILTSPIETVALHQSPPPQVTGLVKDAGDKAAVHALVVPDDDDDDDDDIDGG